MTGLKPTRVFVAGHNGMVGSAVVRYLKKKYYKNIIIQSKNKLDLLKVIVVAIKEQSMFTTSIFKG